MTETEKILLKCTCKCGKGPIKSKRQNRKYQIRCKACRATTSYYLTEAEAIDAWKNGVHREAINVISAT